MPTVKSFDAHKAVILERLLTAWEKSPDSNLGELFYAASEFSGRAISAMSDEELCIAIERFTLLGTKTLGDLIPEEITKPSMSEPVTATRHISSGTIRAMCYHKMLRKDCPTCKNVTDEGA